MARSSQSKLTALSLLVALVFSGCAVEMRTVRVDKKYWLANQYLEHGKEPPLIVEAKVAPVVWLALIDVLFKLVPKVLKHREAMYVERTITIWWTSPEVDNGKLR